ncbi:MAG: protein translocase subunit SecD [Geminicoccaceae bacterium]
MLRTPGWKVALVAVVCLGAILFTIPNLFSRETVAGWPSFLPRDQINLGLDLQGGSHLLLEVETQAVIDERLDAMVDEARAILRGERIGYRGLGVRGGAVTLTLTDPASANRAIELLEDALVSDRINPDVLIEREGDGRLSIALSPAEMEQATSNAVTQALEIVRRRIDEVGTREPTIQRQGDNRILVQVPGEKDPESIKRLLGQTAKLTFHMVDSETSPSEFTGGRAPPGRMLLPDENAVTADGEPQMWVVNRRVEVSGEHLIDAQPTTQDAMPVVSFRFDTVGARRFGNVTQENVGRLLAIVLDDEVISAPRIQSPILGGNGIISGNFTFETANELAILLRAGALPAPMTVIEERTVGPDLGADSIRAGEIAGVLAILAVIVFMLLYYRLFGVFANIALVVNVLLIMAALSILGATLTLPGIAGIVLTIGIAVDANVLIFERIREEIRVGKTPASAIDTGYKQAMRTIIDASVTTLIAAVLLFQFGSGPIKGFAVTLAIGIATSMFTAITLTRMLISEWWRRTRPSTLPL